MGENTTMQQLQTIVRDALERGELIKLTLSKPSSKGGEVTSLDIRPIRIKQALMLSVTYHYRTRDIVKNLAPDAGLDCIAEQLENHFAVAKLRTMQADYTLRRNATGFDLQTAPPSSKTPPNLAHDRTKHRLISTENKPYLHALGITDAKGAVYKNAQDKFRQINKYIEILDGLVRTLPKRDSLRIVDMGRVRDTSPLRSMITSPTRKQWRSRWSGSNTVPI